MLASPWVEVGWNVAAGMAAYLSSFGIAMLASRGAVMLVGPWGGATLLAAGALHTLVAEPMAAKLRATTYQNRWSVAQTASLRPLARRTGDWIRQALADLPPKRVFSVGQQTGLTAAEALAHPDQAGFLKNYLGTFFTDDAPFLSFTVFYTAKNYLAELGPYAQGSLPEIGLQLAAGASAGASTMVIAQALRKHVSHGAFDRATGWNMPTVHKPMRLWGAEALQLAATLAEMDDLLSQWAVLTPDDQDDARAASLRAAIEQLKERRTEVSAALAIASARSGMWSSYCVDVQKMFALKQSAQPGVPERPGTRFQTIASVLAKITSLIMTVTVGTLYQLDSASRRASGAPMSAMMKFVELTIAPVTLIVPLGFAFRTQIQAALFMACGAGKAFYDVTAEAVEPGRYAARRAADSVPPVPVPAQARSAVDDEAAMEAGSSRSAPST
ncbi:MAG: hypothetical protein EOO22_01195 [Comamonadaceae bacterium]|nr:MAG: hypothetical protein EOO22_01195 [Comamonadaceae bacterium]